MNKLLCGIFSLVLQFTVPHAFAGVTVSQGVESQNQIQPSTPVSFDSSKAISTALTKQYPAMKENPSREGLVAMATALGALESQPGIKAAFANAVSEKERSRLADVLVSKGNIVPLKWISLEGYVSQIKLSPLIWKEVNETPQKTIYYVWMYLVNKKEGTMHRDMNKINCQEKTLSKNLRFLDQFDGSNKNRSIQYADDNFKKQTPNTLGSEVIDFVCARAKTARLIEK